MSLGATNQAFETYDLEQFSDDTWKDIMGRDDVNRIEESPRFLLLQLARTEKEVKENHDSQNRKRGELAERFDAKATDLGDRVRKAELWIAEHKSLAKTIDEQKKEIGKLRGMIFRLALLVTGIAGGAGYGAGVLLP